MTSAYHCGNCPKHECDMNPGFIDDDGFVLATPSQTVCSDHPYCSGSCSGEIDGNFHCTAEEHDAAVAAQARDDENKRIVKILEDYRFGLDYPDCPPGDTIKKLVNSLRIGGEP